MYFKVTDKKPLKKYTEIWEKISSLMNIEFDSEPVYCDSDKYIKTKLKSYKDKVNANFQDRKNKTKVNAPCKCLSLIMWDSVIRINKNHYPPSLLEESKYETKN